MCISKGCTYNMSHTNLNTNQFVFGAECCKSNELVRVNVVECIEKGTIGLFVHLFKS